MAVPLTSEAANLTSYVTAMSSLGRPATWHVCRTHRDPPNDVGPVVIWTSYGRATDVISCHFDVRFNVNDVTGRVGNTSDMLVSLSPTSVLSFMTIGQLLCLQQRQNGFHYRECQPMTSLWEFTRTRLTGAARKRV
ncbi:hypothetical protein DPMN_061991 [Dreissena polymorpha]|uniref:Uncharacterized protein n=1 Tax=Dreissena polymorpha TaxID=45954 RepID=A0A9D4C901_DREPO|nr:hypothetical protein DPMN_061991 [Dreissena polymorpha]